MNYRNLEHYDYETKLLYPPCGHHIHNRDGNCVRFKAYAKTGGCCAYCGVKLPTWKNGYVIKPKMHLDHVYPKSRGGADALSNYFAACSECNLKKSNMLAHEWQSTFDSEGVSFYAESIGFVIEDCATNSTSYRPKGFNDGR